MRPPGILLNQTPSTIPRSHHIYHGPSFLTLKHRRTSSCLPCSFLGHLNTARTGFRFYNPDTGRWLNRDPLGETGFELKRFRSATLVGDGPNRFHFVFHRPIELIDVDGLGHGNPVCGLGKCYFEQPWNPPDPSPGFLQCASRIRTEVFERFGWDEDENPQPEHRPGDVHFYYGHCVASCRLMRDCGMGPCRTFVFGFAEETRDFIMGIIRHGEVHHFSPGDLNANKQGRDRAISMPGKSCEDACTGTEG